MPALAPANPVLVRGVVTVFIVVLAFLVRRWLNALLVPRARVGHARYLAHKAVGVLTIAGALVALAVTWVEDAGALGVSLGIIGAGFAVALQQPITSVFGLLVIITHRLFRVGDRIEIGDTKGDVIDIHAFHTKVMEIGEWMEGESWTGRIVTVPKAMFLDQRLMNYTKDFAFLWDAVTIPTTHSSDWERAETVVRDVAYENTHHLEDPARRSLAGMQMNYLVPAVTTEPRTFVKPTDDWLELTVRFVTTPRGRKRMKSRILEQVLSRLQDESDVEIATERLRLYDGWRGEDGG